MTTERKIRLPRHFTEKETQEWMKQVTNFLNKIVDVPDDSTASTVAELVTDHNAFKQHLRDVTSEVTT